MADYDASVSLDIAARGKLTDEETKDLKKNKLQHLFGFMDEDVSDILDYSFAMVNNGKSMAFVVKEIVEMGMDFCPEDKAHQLAKILAQYIQEKNGKALQGEAPYKTAAGANNNRRVVSLKSKTEGNALSLSGALGSNNKKKNISSASSPQENALSLAGALGSSRSDKQTRQKITINKISQNNNNHRENRRDGRGREGGRIGGGREGRGNSGCDRGDRKSGQSAAFDRLSNDNSDYINGGGNRSRRTGDDNRVPSRGRNGGGGGRGHGERGGRFSGIRRDLDPSEEEDFIPAPLGCGGRGGRASKEPARDGGRGGPNKRMRMDNEVGQGDCTQDVSYEGCNGYADYAFGSYDDGSYGYGMYTPFPYHNRGRGRGMGRGQGRGRGNLAALEAPAGGGAHPRATSVAAEGGKGAKIGHEQQLGAGDSGGASGGSDMNAEAAEYHPSPIVTTTYGGRFGFSGYRGRGRGFRGRGFRSHSFPGRSHVAGMIASMAWVRPKDTDAGCGAAAEEGAVAP